MIIYKITNNINNNINKQIKSRKVMKKKNDIYKLGCCFFVNNRRIF